MTRLVAYEIISSSFKIKRQKESIIFIFNAIAETNKPKIIKNYNQVKSFVDILD